MTRVTLTDRGLFLPVSVFSLWEPSNPISWGVRGLLHFITVLTWLLAVCSWLLPLLLASEHILGSWRQYQRRRDQYAHHSS